jgi:hypothetical protein
MPKYATASREAATLAEQAGHAREVQPLPDAPAFLENNLSRKRLCVKNRCAGRRRTDSPRCAWQPVPVDVVANEEPVQRPARLNAGKDGPWNLLGSMHCLAHDSQFEFALTIRFLKGPNVELSGAKRQAAQRKE